MSTERAERGMSDERRAEIDRHLETSDRVYGGKGLVEVALLRDAVAEIDHLKLDNAWLRNIADGRGDEEYKVRRLLTAAQAEIDDLRAALGEPGDE